MSGDCKLHQVKDYYVVRCAGRDTMKLQDDLINEGLECWTPIHKRRMRMPVSRKVKMIDVPTIPSFAFIKIADFYKAKSAMDIARCPQFNPMRHGDGYASVYERELDGLKGNEAKALINKSSFLPMDAIAEIMDGPMKDRSVKIIGHTSQHNIVEDLLTNLKMYLSPVSLKAQAT